MCCVLKNVRVYDLFFLVKIVMFYMLVNNFLDIFGIFKIFVNLKIIFIDNGGGGGCKCFKKIKE